MHFPGHDGKPGLAGPQGVRGVVGDRQVFLLLRIIIDIQNYNLLYHLSKFMEFSKLYPNNYMQ